VIVIAREKSSGLAAILSFFWCGLGQIYTGHIAKGVTMMAVYPFLWILGLMLTFGGCVSAAGAKTANEQANAGSTLLFGLIISNRRLLAVDVRYGECLSHC
jgi:TM2 domain-containing membrane protein YozV